MYVNKYDTKDCKVRDDRRDGADKSDAKSGNYQNGRKQHR